MYGLTRKCDVFSFIVCSLRAGSLGCLFTVSKSVYHRAQYIEIYNPDVPGVSSYHASLSAAHQCIRTQR